MSILSPHLREQGYGRRAVCFSLHDGVVVADSAEQGTDPDPAQKMLLRMTDGSVGVADAHGWNISCDPGDVITQVCLSRPHKTKKHLAAIINRSQRERQCVRPLGVLLRKARVSREFTWWLSFIVLLVGAVITDCGFFARDIAVALTPIQEVMSGPLQPGLYFVTHPLNIALNALPMPAWSGQASAMFGSLQDHRVLALVSVLFLILIVWSRSFRLLAVPVFMYCLFILKTRLYGFDSAQGVVLFWYAPLLGLLVLTGLVNRYRDRWRMAARLSAICKSQMAQPLPHNLVKETQPEPGEQPLHGDTAPEPERQDTGAALSP